MFRSSGIAACLSSIALTMAALSPPASAIDFVPPDRGRPGSREGAGTRRGPVAEDRCSYRGDRPLTALMPNTNLGLTADPYPTFFFYIPETDARMVEFFIEAEVEDGTGQKRYEEIYRTRIEITGEARTIALELPAAAGLAPLEEGREHYWSLMLLCTPQREIAYVDGWVERVAPPASLRSALESATAAERPSLYAEAGLWYDTLEALAELQQADPTDPNWQRDWANLLESVGLESLADASANP